ncbi:MAG: hypothetical protein JWL96_642 [Sphingomonas bacterium]|uniref:type II toxin-antitoxin system VapC family toxin n=1 Tax=Sphingomonas bacterium TaxID=1895847 RepID=UPI0026025C2A|nr:type II toxin-antitoxin system VapC family toxin [Sphingomonas bacterium]MDB5708572.1 hypothetical protein [Sphingomonas bacterium]
MKLLLDTHFLIWLMSDPTELSSRERDAIDQAEALYLSAASFWELRIKWHTRDRSGQRKGSVDPSLAIAYAERNPFVLATLDADDATVELDPPIQHRDPFDEILLVHARRLGARLLTRDGKLVNHPLALQL